MNQAVGFVGAGNMATAIIRGFSKHAESDLFVYDIDAEKAEKLLAYGAKACDSIAALAAKVKYLFLAVKPQNFPEALAEVKGNINPDTVIVSIAAGITATYISQVVGFDAKVVLVMPNTPLLLGCGATALSNATHATEKEFAFCCHIFESSGEIAVIPSDKMNEIIPINGSSPAFIYQFAKHFITYAQENGIDYDMAMKLFAQSLIGSANMMLHSGNSLDDLIKMVSSKGGTTIAGLEAFEEKHLDEAVHHACEKCVKRAYELSK